MIEIKDISGKTRFSTPINKGAKGKFILMKEDYIILPFSVSEPVYFKLGDYVDLSGVLDDSLGGLMSKRYEIVDLQTPTFNSSTGGYDYQLRLDAYYWKWKNKIFKYTPGHAGYVASWSLTATLDVQLGVFLRNLNALGYKFNGKDFEFSIDSTVENKAVAMTYDNMNLLDALFLMAGEDKWNCDCWITDNVIHFGRNEYGDSVKLELGVEVSSMTRSESKGTFATRIFAFGSTKNIPENYRPIEEQAVINGVVQKRLMLPADTPFIDVYPDMSEEEAVEDVVVFDEVYPRRVGTLSDVKTVDRALTGEDGEQVGTFKAYQYKDTGLNFNKEYIIEGQELEITFQSGKLNGLKFGAIFEPEGTSSGSQIWEIEANEDYGRLLPDDTLFPENGDEYILTGFNIQLVSDQYIPAAEQELKDKALKYAEQRKKDDGTYNTTLRSKWVYQDRLKRFYEFGQKVTLINKAFFENGRESRILGWEFKLDIPWDNPTYVIGESMPYSRINAIEEKLETLTYKGQTYTGSGGGSGVYVIRTNDSTAPSDSNVFSAKRSLVTLMRKDIEDYVPKMKTSSIESKSFVGGSLGSGFQLKQNADGQTYIEIDKMYVRLKAYFDSLEIREISHIGGQLLLTAASMKCSHVEVIEPQPVFYIDGTRKVYSDGRLAYTAARYRCYFNADDGDAAVVNQFVIGDFAMCRQFNIKAGVHENVSNRYYWYEVVGVGDNYIDFSQGQCDEGSDIPQAGDTIVQLGNRNDPYRQNAILLSSVGDNAPCKILYQGINDYSLDGKAIIEEGFDSHSGQAYQKIYGKTYIGARDESSYLSFDPITQKLKVRGDVEVTGGFNNEIAQQMGYSDYAEMIALAQQGKTIISGGFINTSLIEAKAITADMMNADGITANNVDITGKITATSGSFNGEVTATSGSFTGTVNANDGVLGSMTIRDGSYEYGIFYNGDNTTLSMRPGMFMNIPYNVFTPEDGTPQSNVLLYLKRRRNNVYDRSIYIEGISEFYGRVGIGKANNTGMNQFLPALVVEGIGCYGQFCLDNKIIKSSTVLDNTYTIAFVEMSSSGGYIRLPSSNLTNGQILIIRKVDGSNFKIYGRIKNTSNKLVDEISITNASFNMFIYNKTYNYWVLNYMN